MTPHATPLPPARYFGRCHRHLVALMIVLLSNIAASPLFAASRMSVARAQESVNVVAPAPSTAPVVFAVTEVNQLISFRADQPGTILSNVAISGTTGRLLGIDFRPLNGVLYGFDESSLYTINTSTGVATTVSSPFVNLALEGFSFGFDFNPVADRIRIVSDADENLRLNPDTGAVIVDTDLAYAEDDESEGFDPFIVGAAYTDNRAGTTSTALYDLDLNLLNLVIQNPPNNGTLFTIRQIIDDLGFDTGFDIGSRNNTGYVSTNIADEPETRFYRIDDVGATAGGAVFVGAISGDFGHVTDIAVSLITLRVEPAQISGCQSARGTVALDAPAPQGGTRVMLSSSNPALASVPSSFLIGAGQRSRSFPITTTPVSSVQTVTITASGAGITIRRTLTLRPVGVTALIINPNQTVGGNSVQVTVRLECAAPAGGINLTVTSSRPSVANPPNPFFIPEGELEGTFTLDTNRVSVQTDVVLRASTSSGQTRNARLRVLPCNSGSGGGFCGSF